MAKKDLEWRKKNSKILWFVQVGQVWATSGRNSTLTQKGWRRMEMIPWELPLFWCMKGFDKLLFWCIIMIWRLNAYNICYSLRDNRNLCVFLSWFPSWRPSSCTSCKKITKRTKLGHVIISKIEQNVVVIMADQNHYIDCTFLDF